MNELAKLIPVKIRKTIYAIAGAVNAIALIVFPLLASLNIVDDGLAQQIVTVIGQVLALIAGLVAIPNTKPTATVDPNGN